MDFKVCGTDRRASPPCRWTTRPRACPPRSSAVRSNRPSEGRALHPDGHARARSARPARRAVASTAPRIETIKIPVDKIRDVIGSGGKVVRGIQEETGASIDIQEDGTIHIAAGRGHRPVRPPRRMILGIVKEPEVGEDLRGRGRRHQGLRRLRQAHARQGRPAAHLAAWPTAASARWRTCLPWATPSRSKCIEIDPKTGKISAGPPGQARCPRGQLQAAQRQGSRQRPSRPRPQARQQEAAPQGLSACASQRPDEARGTRARAQKPIRSGHASSAPFCVFRAQTVRARAPRSSRPGCAPSCAPFVSLMENALPVLRDSPQGKVMVEYRDFYEFREQSSGTTQRDIRRRWPEQGRHPLRRRQARHLR